MCVCLQSCLATLVVTALVFMPQNEGFPIEGFSQNPSELQKPVTFETKDIADKQPNLKSLTETSNTEKQPHASGGDKESDVKSEIPRISVAGDTVVEHLAEPEVSSRTDQQRPPLQQASEIKQSALNVVPQSKDNKPGAPSPSETRQIHEDEVANHPPEAVPSFSPAKPEPDNVPRKSETGDSVPQINVSVTKVTTPGLGSPPATSPAHNERVTITEVNPAKQSAEIDAKVDGPVTPSASTEVTVKQTPPSPSPAIPSENEGKDRLRSSVEPAGGQPLVTVITPLHAALILTDGRAPSTATESKPQNSPTATETVPSHSQEDGSNKSKLSLEPMIDNSFTITPKQFAKKTADVLAQKMDEKTIDTNKQDSHKEDIIVTAPKLGQEDKTEDNEKPSGTTNGPTIVIENTTGTVNAKDKSYEQPEKATQETVVENTQKSTVQTEDLSVIRLANKITTKLKEIIDEGTKVWNERKEKVSWLGEATEVLQTYNDKITETKPFIRPTCANDREKYEDRKQNLIRIKNNCEKSLKRIQWHELVNETNEKLQRIAKLIEDYQAQINEIPKDQNYDSRKLEIEKITKLKLQDYDSQSYEKTLTDLKDAALKIDEEEYTKCIDSDGPNKEGSTIITETQLAIMKIYSCV